MIPQYQKKSSEIIVEALLVNLDNVDRIANWAQAQIVEERDPITGEPSEGLNIKTADGRRNRASRGTYVVKMQDKFYLVGEKAFISLYIPYGPPASLLAPPTRADTLPDLSTTDPFENMTRFNEGPKP